MKQQDVTRNSKGQFVKGSTLYPDGKPICSIEGCRNQSRARGWCQTHYMRWFHNGDPKSAIRKKRGPAIERFEFMVNKDGPVLDERLGACWIWKGRPDKRGYGRFADETGWRDMAHRWSYKHFVGPIPRDLFIDHLCYNPPCVNPKHLEPVTQLENTMVRGRSNAAYLNANKTHCKQGHAFVPDNTYYTNVHGQVTRTCKTCHKRRVAEYLSRKKSQGIAA